MTYGMIAAVIVVLMIIWYISVGNRFRRLAVKIDESESGIDVGLTKRYDTLTKMIDVCRQYAAHEVDTLTKVIQMRSGMSMAERSTADAQMGQMTEQIRILAEAYPELRSSDVFQQLQGGIRDVEEHLQAARRFYNSNVSVFNQLLVSFPASIVGKQQGQKQKDFFEADERKKEDVTINFS